MELERAMARLSEACKELEAVALQRSVFDTKRANYMRSENNALLKTNEQIAQRLDAAIARLRTLLGE